ncbi:MAG TPA: ABC transporter permease [Bryobacteraceae bacterium]|nr:ABC transporter permease [Bryobacteraceae bacterium]
MLSHLRSGKKLGFSLVVIAVLALGIGANTALFSIIDRVLLHPFPFRGLDRLVEVEGITGKGSRVGTAPLETNFFAARVRSLQQVSMWRWQNLVLTGVDNTDSIFALEVSDNLFDALGTPAALGRTLVVSDFGSSAPAVVVISDRLWRQHFRGDPSIVGRQILLDGQGYTVVGVMGPDFVFTNPAHEAWIPYKAGGTQEELRHAFSTLARLAPGVSMEQAQQEINAIAPSLPPSKERDAGWHLRLRPFTEQFTGEYRQALLILWSAVGLVLLIACANAANLLLARASERRREFAIRASLGADQFRLMRQVIGETLVLGICAGVAGVGLAFGFIRLMVVLFPDHLPLPRLDSVAINPAAVAVTVGLVLITTLLCALPACASLWRSDLTVALGAGSRSMSASRGANRLRSAMLAFEVALSIMLLAGAGLMLRTMERLMQVRLGFDPQHVLTAKVSVPSQLKTKAEQAAHYTRMLAEVRTLPGVLDAGIATVLPFGGLVATTSFTAEGQEKAVQPPHDGAHAVYLREISPGYFSALGTRLLRGRDFEAGDTAGSLPVVIINDETARRYWPGEDPLGKRVSRSDHPKAGEWSTVVGVVESVKHRSLRTGADAELYFPYTQELIGAKYTYLTLRVQGDPLSLAASLRARIRQVDPGQPVTDVKTMRAHVVDSAAEVRFHTLLLEIFAGLALGLAVAGIFAVVSYAVSQRTREIGIRGALGAGPRELVRFVLGMAMRPVALGACVGIAGGLAATRVLQSELFETAAADPVVFGAVFVMLMATAVAAAAIPAWRATRVDPAEVLRGE